MTEPDFEELARLAAQDMEKGSERIARAFYRTLRKSGLSEQQVICVATNLITCLNESLKGYEKKVEDSCPPESSPGKQASESKFSRSHRRNRSR